MELDIKNIKVNANAQYNWIKQIRDLQPIINGEPFRVAKRNEEGKPVIQEIWDNVTVNFFPVDDHDIPGQLVIFDFDSEDKQQNSSNITKIEDFFKENNIPHFINKKEEYENSKGFHLYVFLKASENALKGGGYKLIRKVFVDYTLKKCGINDKSGFDMNNVTASRHLIRAWKVNIPDRIEFFEISDGKLKEMMKFNRASEKKKSKEKNDEKKRETTSFFEDGNAMYEQVYDPVTKISRFAKASLNGEGIEIVDEIETENVILIPINDDALREGAVLLPSEPLDYGDTKSLIGEIQAHIHKYVDISKDYEKISAWYILLSWVYDKINTLPYLRALGDTGSGKSRFLDSIGRLCYKATIVSGSVTPAPIYRMIRKWHGTIVLDEADRKYSDEKDEVVTILNCGFERGRPVIRSQKDNPDNIQVLPTFSPKVFATRGRFKDTALESRCLTEKVMETTRKDISPLLLKAFYEKEAELRNKLLMFRFRNRHKIDTEKVNELDLGEIEPRLKQVSSSFAILFSNIPEMMSEFRDFLQNFNVELVEQRATTNEGFIINAIFDIIMSSNIDTHILDTDGTHDTEVSAQDIQDHLKGENGIDIHFRKIGGILKNTFGLDTKKRRIGEKTKRCLIWDSKKMATIKKRYVPCGSSVPCIKGTIPLDTEEKYPYGIPDNSIVKADKARQRDNLRIKVKFLKPLPESFIGSDLVDYGSFQIGDVSELPKEQGVILINQKFAEEI